MIRRPWSTGCARSAFEQYPGLLHGTRGTLIGRAGNALDTAFLLAHLLDRAGYEARIVHSTLPEAAPRTLVEQMMAPHAPSAAMGDVWTAALTALLVELGQAFGLSERESKAQLTTALKPDPADPALTAAPTGCRFIQTTLADAGVTLGDDTALDKVVTEATDYFWVRSG